MKRSNHRKRILSAALAVITVAFAVGCGTGTREATTASSGQGDPTGGGLLTEGNFTIKSILEIDLDKSTATFPLHKGFGPDGSTPVWYIITEARVTSAWRRPERQLRTEARQHVDRLLDLRPGDHPHHLARQQVQRGAGQLRGHPRLRPDPRAHAGTDRVPAARAQPGVTGDFNGDRRTDVYWYQPGGDPIVAEPCCNYEPNARRDQLWLAGVDGTWARRDLSMVDTAIPLVGDFDRDGTDDITWSQPGRGADSMWRFRNGVPTTIPLTISGSVAPA